MLHSLALPALAFFRLGSHPCIIQVTEKVPRHSHSRLCSSKHSNSRQSSEYSSRKIGYGRQLASSPSDCLLFSEACFFFRGRGFSLGIRRLYKRSFRPWSRLRVGTHVSGRSQKTLRAVLQ